MSRPLKTRADPDETRERILETAEEHFRRIGYQKTAVADIAETLGMSPANVYRFFSSKGAIVGCICERILSEVIDVAFKTAQGPGSAAERLEKLLIEVHLHHRRTLLKDKRVHDMVSAAMAENWENIETFKTRFGTIVEGLVREGNASGEFAVPDPAAAAHCVKAGYVAFVHPMMIEECIRHGEDVDLASRMMARFLVDALRPRRPAGG